jgi:hypothetical protein
MRAQLTWTPRGFCQKNKYGFAKIIPKMSERGYKRSWRSFSTLAIFLFNIIQLHSGIARIVALRRGIYTSLNEVTSTDGALQHHVC